MRRLELAFLRVRQQAAQAFPWLDGAELKICRGAEAEHRKSWRQFAHTGHGKFKVCIAASAEELLRDDELVGIFAHELGHIVGDELKFPEHSRPWRGEKTPERVQREANEISRDFFGIKVRYNARRIQTGRLYGRSLGNSMNR